MYTIKDNHQLMERTMANAAFQIGDRVVDRDGFKGTVRLVTEHDGVCWYDVRFERGEAVRYDGDLTEVS